MSTTTAPTSGTASAAGGATATVRIQSMRELLLGNARSYGIYVALIVVIAAFQFLTGGRLLNPNNVVALFQQNAYVLIAAIGMLMVIIATHIDLSLGSAVAFIGGAGAFAMRHWGLNWMAAIAMMLAIGLLIGAWHGFWVAYVGVPGFVTTLGGMLVFRGLATVVAGESIPVSDGAFRAISKDYLPNIFGFWGYFASNALILGALAIVLLVWSQWRKRARALRHGLPVQPVGFVVLKCAVGVLAIGYLTYLLASSGNDTQGGVPIVLVVR